MLEQEQKIETAPLSVDIISEIDYDAGEFPKLDIKAFEDSFNNRSYARIEDGDDNWLEHYASWCLNDFLKLYEERGYPTPDWYMIEAVDGEIQITWSDDWSLKTIASD